MDMTGRTTVGAGVPGGFASGGSVPRRVPGNRWDLLDGQAPSPLPSVSVIVTHYEQHRQLDRTLRALNRQDYPADLIQVIVADDGSVEPPAVPGGVALVRQRDEGFRAAAARNLGVSHATGGILCFLDADTAPEPAYVGHLTRLAGLAPEAVTVGRRRHADLSSVAVDVPVEIAGPAHALPEPQWLTDAYRRSGDLLDSDDRSYRHILSSVLACSRAFFDEVGGFDETFTRYGGEDWEWAHRAWRDGAVFAHVSDAVAWHDGPDWSSRRGSGSADKNAEALRLAELITVPGSRPRAVLGARPDTLVRLRGRWSAAAQFVCCDSLLEALPHSRMMVDAAVPALFGDDPRIAGDAASVADARVVSTVIRPFALLGRAGSQLAELIGDLGSAERGALIVRGRDGREVMRAQARRASRRHRRWGADDAFSTEDVRLDDAVPLRAEPDVEAWLGGWAGAEHLG